MTEWAAFRRRRDEAVQAVVVVASAGLGLVRPARLSPGWLLLYRLATAGLAGVTVWSALSRDPFPDERFTVGAGLGAAGLTMAVAPVAESVDERLHRRLQHAGARHPRRLLAAGTLLVGALAALLDRRLAAAPIWPAEADDPEQGLVDVPAEVRALAAALLAQTDQYGAAELRAQLATARAELYQGPTADGFWAGIGFHTDPALPRAVPGEANFPVIGRYTAIEDRSFEVYITITGGMLANLSISEGSDWGEQDRQSWELADRGIHELTGWPTPTELTFYIETPSGPQALVAQG